MIPLSATGKAHDVTERLVARVVSDVVPVESRHDAVLVAQRWPSDDDARGFEAVLCNEQAPRMLPVPSVSAIRTEHLTDGDVVCIDPSGFVRTLYRRQSQHNALFVTDQCNSYCVMCSQPPKKIDDRDRLAEHLRLIGLINPETTFLGVTGGEPTLFKDGFLEIVRACKQRLPRTALHVLSNGRLFYYGAFASALSEIEHPDLTLGIPLYSDLDYEHDHVVQARNAFDETVVGLQNLANHGLAVEIRVVVHRLTVQRLPELAAFIYRNFTFANHVAFMGLEAMGFAVSNMDSLWIDPWDYREKLREAVLALADRGMNVSVYNHQLCTLPHDVWGFSRKSISDWKNEYLSTCSECLVREDCGGFFSSSVARHRVSSHIRPPTLTVSTQ